MCRGFLYSDEVNHNKRELPARAAHCVGHLFAFGGPTFREPPGSVARHPAEVLGLVCAAVCWSEGSERGRRVGLQISGVGDSGGSRRPVGGVPQAQGQLGVADPWGLVPPTEQPEEEGRGPAIVGLLGTRKD